MAAAGTIAPDVSIWEFVTMKSAFRTTFCIAAALGLGVRADATVFTFATDPFAGTTALTTPGRQIIGNEISIPVFDFANDVIAINKSVFNVPGLTLFNGEVGDIPQTGVNLVALRTFDSDGNPANGNQLAAGSAATLIADRITASGPGFFIYFNSGLDLPRLVFSTDLGSPDADLKVLARFTGLTGQAGRDSMAYFADANFAAVPEPASWAMIVGGFGLLGAAVRRRPHPKAVLV